MPVTESGLEIEIIEPGSGPYPSEGDTVVVHYTGMFADGRVFESSYEGEPISFMLQRGEVIAGWDEGIMTLAQGSKARLTVPPELGYGEFGADDVIPPHSILIFDVELLAINP